jgi:hypothetical protein
MRPCLFLLVLAVLVVLPAQAAPIVADGRSEYTIVVSPDAIAPERTAAKELQTFLKQSTGVKLPIASPAAAGNGPRLVVGACEAFGAACPDVDLAALKHDGIVLRTIGRDVYFAGGRPRGTLYAVYTFLEDTVGVRWWSSTETFVPHRRTLDLPRLNVVYVPKLQCREAFYRDAFDGVYAARSKCNGHFERVSAEYGGHYTLLGWCHTFYQLLPPDKYFAQHPDWYSLINGKRQTDGAQLCLTNREMRAELVRRALEWIKRDPQAGMISIAQNDCGGPCQCRDCQAIVDREGSQSGPIIQFVNQVAEAIEKQYPDFFVETLAYSYTRKPPASVRPRRNVVVRLCSIECSYSQPLATGPQNASFRADIDRWSAVTPQLYIWDYVTNFANYIIPHPNLRVLGPNIRLFVNKGAIGLFEQGDAGCSCSDFPELRAWLISHLMWDPSRNDQALIAEFMRGYYGAAAPALLEYIGLIHNSVEKTDAYLRCYTDDTASYLRLPELTRAWKLFADAARAVQDDPVLSGRVRRARMPLDHEWIKRYTGLKRAAALKGVAFTGPADRAALVADFLKSAAEFNAGQLSEGRPFGPYAEGLKSLVAHTAATRPPKECERLPTDDWMDIQDHEFTFHNPGAWVASVEDAKASDGHAARMPGSHTQWATQYLVPGDLGGLGRWHCYASLRCETVARTGAACQVGLYNEPGKKGETTITVQIPDVANGEYHTIDLGVHELKPGLYFWIAPMGKKSEVTAVYTDRIFLAKER